MQIKHYCAFYIFQKCLCFFIGMFQSVPGAVSYYGKNKYRFHKLKLIFFLLHFGRAIYWQQDQIRRRKTKLVCFHCKRKHLGPFACNVLESPKMTFLVFKTLLQAKSTNNSNEICGVITFTVIQLKPHILFVPIPKL